MPNLAGDFAAVGLTEIMGNPWWSGDDSYGIEYPGAVPLSVVYQLVGFEPSFQRLPYTYAGDDEAPLMVVHPDTTHLLGLVGKDYPQTGYRTRLIDGLAKLTDTSEGKLIFGSALLLQGGRQAAIQIALGDPLIHTPTGEQFSQWLMAYSSLDMSQPTTFKLGCTRVVCRNTYMAFKAETGGKYFYRNTTHSGLKIAEAREVLNLFGIMGEDLFAQLERETEQIITEPQWEFIKEGVFPTKDVAKKAATIAANNQQIVDNIYRADERVGFVGTQWGAFQAFSVMKQHETTVREGLTKMGRNMGWIMGGSGKTPNALTQFDIQVQQVIEKALATVK